MSEEPTDGQIAGEAIRNAIREQISASDPPEAPLTFQRLRALGLSEDQAIEFMAAVLASEIFGMLKEQKPYDLQHYEESLRALPTLPWERDGTK